MNGFLHPLYLVFGLAWILLMLVFYARQRSSLRSLRTKVAPRFFRTFTVYSEKGLLLHAGGLLAAGLLLVIAAAAPVRRGDVETVKSADSVILVLDASMSMYAGDTQKIPGLPQFDDRRKEETGVAQAIIESLPDYRFGLVSFSGIAEYHSAPTWDHAALLSELRGFRLHAYERTGSDFKAALSAIFHLAERSPRLACQAVLFSDGEKENSGDYLDELRILRKLGVRVHTVGVGTLAGSRVDLYEPSDVVAGSSSPDVAKVVTTHRVEKELRRIAAATGGTAFALERGTSVKDIVTVLQKTPGRKTSIRQTGFRDASGIFILLFGLIFLADTLGLDALRFWRKAFRGKTAVPGGGSR